MTHCNMTRGAIALALATTLVWGCSGSGGGGGGAAVAAPAGTSTGTSAGAGSGPGATTATTAFERFAQLRSSIAGRSTTRQQSQLDAFIAAQSATEEGFPLRDGARVAFVWRGRPTTAPVVAGAFNAWSTSAQPLTRIGATDVWFAEVTLPAADRFEYKFVSGSTWLADPLNRKFTYDNANSVANAPASGKSHLERIRAFPSSYVAARDILVYLPRGYLDSPAKRYPVLYMHDGQNLFDPGAPFGMWDVQGTCDRLIAAGAIKDLIVVGIPAVDRFGEYTHVADCVGSSVIGGDAADYARFIVSELKPAIDQRYRTLPSRDDTGILGSSLGGLISILIGYDHPAVFKNVGGMSSTFDWGSYCTAQPTAIDIVRAKGKQDLRVYIDCGGRGPIAPGEDNWDSTEAMKVLLEQQGHQHGVDLLHWWEPGAVHNEAAWRVRLEKPLRFWFPR
jgi:predicted alpha/beta superfamily hydrolase